MKNRRRWSQLSHLILCLETMAVGGILYVAVYLMLLSCKIFLQVNSPFLARTIIYRLLGFLIVLFLIPSPDMLCGIGRIVFQSLRRVLRKSKAVRAWLNGRIRQTRSRSRGREIIIGARFNVWRGRFGMGILTARFSLRIFENEECKFDWVLHSCALGILAFFHNELVNREITKQETKASIRCFYSIWRDNFVIYADHHLISPGGR